MDSLLGSARLLVSSSALLLLWNLVGLDARAFDSGPLRVLSAIPKGIVPVVLIFLIVYQAYSLFRDSRLSPPDPDKAFVIGVDMSIAYLLAASAVLSYFSHLSLGGLVAAIWLSPTCLAFSGFGWVLVIPSGYALLRSSAQVFSTEGLNTMALAMFSVGALAIWIAASIAGNAWPVWVGVWAGLPLAFVIIVGWRHR